MTGSTDIHLCVRAIDILSASSNFLSTRQFMPAPFKYKIGYIFCRMFFIVMVFPLFSPNFKTIRSYTADSHNGRFRTVVGKRGCNNNRIRIIMV